MEKSYWIHLSQFWPTEDDGRSVYDVVLEEMRQDLKKGTIVLMGSVKQEGRLTAMYSHVNAVMKYSGRVVTPIKPKNGGYLSMMLEMVSTEEFRENLYADCPELRGRIPPFNAVFVNWYRPPNLCDGDKMDSIGAHSDDVRELDSEIIFSLTFCEEGGERLFSFFDKTAGENMVWQSELKNGDAVFMLEGCQKLYKHSVSSRKTHLDRSKITGGRINFTFRMMKLDDK